MKEFEDKISKIKQFLQNLNEYKNNKKKQISEENKDTSIIEIEEIFINSLQSKLYEFYKIFQNITIIKKNKVKSKIHQKIKMYYRDLSDDEVKEISKNPEKVNKYIETAIYGTDTNLTTALKDIQDKYNDIVTLENNINELTDIINNLSEAVFTNSEKINGIKGKLINITGYIKTGGENTQEAQKEFWKYQEKMWCVIFMVFIIVIVVFLTVYKIYFN